MWTANLFQVTTGSIGPQVRFSELKWNIDLNDTESIDIELMKSDIPPVDRNLWLSPWWGGVLLSWDGTPIVAGPIMSRPNETYKSVSVSCGGIRSLLAKRLVTQELSDWTKLSKSKVSYSKLSLPTIAKRVVQQSQNKYAGSLPISYAIPDQVGTHQRNYEGFNVQNINCHEVLTKLSNVIDGPDVMFRPKLIRDNLLTFEMWTGTEGNPRIYQQFTPVWDTTVQHGNVVDLRIVTTGSYQTNRTYAIGAGEDQGKLIVVNTDERPMNKLYPLLETVVDTGNSENRSVVASHGDSNLETNSEPLVEIQMRVRGDGPIPFGHFWPGDLVEVIAKDWIGLPNGKTKMRLLSMTGNHTPEVTVSLQRDDRYSI